MSMTMSATSPDARNDSVLVVVSFVVLAANLMLAAGLHAAPVCEGGEIIFYNGQEVGCFYQESFGDAERKLCKGTVILEPVEPDGDCWVCIDEKLVLLAEDPGQWDRLRVGGQPADFSCRGSAEPCEVCTCPRGWYDSNRESCVIGACEVEGMPDGDKGGGFFAWQGTLFRDIPGADCTQGAWGEWLNRDAPSGKGDYETLKDFVANGQVCQGPGGVECRRRSDQLAWDKTGEVYRCEKSLGGVCVNGQQARGRRCSDYEVRFCCP